MTTTISRRYTFEAAHFLPNVHENHKCKRMHGHNYEIVIHVTGEVGYRSGFVIDFWDLDKFVDPLVAQLDHRVLNDAGIANPTAENIAHWFRDKLAHALDDTEHPAHIASVTCYETKDCWATVTV